MGSRKKKKLDDELAPAEGGRTLFVCVRDRNGKGASCAGSGARALLKQMQSILTDEAIAPEELALRPCGCIGLCKQGPALVATAGQKATQKKPPKPGKKPGKKATRGVFTQVEGNEAREVLRAALLSPPFAG